MGVSISKCQLLCNVPIWGVTMSLFDIYLAFRNVNQIGYYTTLLNSVGAAEFSTLPKPHNSTATSPVYLSQPSPFL